MCPCPALDLSSLPFPTRQEFPSVVGSHTKQGTVCPEVYGPAPAGHVYVTADCLSLAGALGDSVCSEWNAAQVFLEGCWMKDMLTPLACGPALLTHLLFLLCLCFDKAAPAPTLSLSHLSGTCITSQYTHSHLLPSLSCLERTKRYQ